MNEDMRGLTFFVAKMVPYKSQVRYKRYIYILTKI